MPLYPYKCPDRHITEAVFPWAKFPQELECGECGAQARRVIIYSPQINVDHTDQNGFDHGAGRYFSSRTDRKEWLRATNSFEVGPEDSSKTLAHLETLREMKRDTGKIPNVTMSHNTPVQHAYPEVSLD